MKIWKSLSKIILIVQTNTWFCVNSKISINLETYAHKVLTKTLFSNTQKGYLKKDSKEFPEDVDFTWWYQKYLLVCFTKEMKTIQMRFLQPICRLYVVYVFEYN